MFAVGSGGYRARPAGAHRGADVPAAETPVPAEPLAAAAAEPSPSVGAEPSTDKAAAPAEAEAPPTPSTDEPACKPWSDDESLETEAPLHRWTEEPMMRNPQGLVGTAAIEAGAVYGWAAAGSGLRPPADR
ncbi:hypothetical protein GCM10010282_66270 [Streptomyces roseolus]|nr:hypothetical protein GCM10010282_66270 [Streptomyces roseolus]